jgi:DNA-binding transcriptional LysR family regulator
MALDLNLLRDFAIVVREGGFAAAARASGIPKSTLSMRVIRLEAELRVRLLERTTRAVRLTEDGSKLYEQARRALADIGEAEQLLRERSSVPSGHLRISAPVLFGTILGGGLVAEYTRRWPETTVELILSDRRVDIVEEGFDLAIRTGALTGGSLKARRFATATQRLVAAPKIAARFTSAQDPATLKAADFIVVTGTAAPGTKAVWQLTNGPRVVEIDIGGRIALSSLIAARDAAIEGAGIAFLPTFLVKSALATGELENVLPDWTGKPVDIAAVFPAHREPSMRVREFINLLLESFPDRRLE